jgi:hypothetical protein
MASATPSWSRRFGRLVLAGALGAAALALPACGGDPAAPAEPGGNVDPAASSGVGGAVNKAKDTAGAVENRDAAVDGAGATP